MSKSDSANSASIESSIYGREEVVRRLTRAKSLLLLTHDRPDGDGLGSMVALAVAARLKGKTVQLAVQKPLPRRYEFLLAGETVLEAGEAKSAAAAADCIVVLDTCTWNQLETWAPVLRDVAEKTIVIDHHRTHEAVGAVRWLDDSAAAVGVMVTELLLRLDWPADEKVGRSAMAAICSDTGWLRFSNTDSRALKAVGHWIDLGSRPDELYRELYECDRPQRMALVARALTSLQLHCDGQLAVMKITARDFAETGAEPDETENIVNEAMRIHCVEVALLLVETGDVIRTSLRSKSRVDVAAVAKAFGGGGHARAAGLRAPGPIDALAGRLVEAVGKAVGA